MVMAGFNLVCFAAVFNSGDISQLEAGSLTRDMLTDYHLCLLYFSPEA